MNKSIKGDLVDIPGVGNRLASYMRDIGINCVEDLKGQSADDLYERLCDFKAAHVDRCMLYVFRSSIYYAENKDHDPELLKWWNWKDKQ